MNKDHPAKILAKAAREQKQQEAEYQDRIFVERVREALIEIIKESDTLRMPELEQQEPHSRACGYRAHPHGPECHSNCPTCGGPIPAWEVELLTPPPSSSYEKAPLSPLPPCGPDCGCH